ncbi:STAS domain-containing protein [Nocardioides sp.]|uniref:STAS domain-containing protein n=1 Tax=Nocardioides sp. TaxID=35761 RepID=UPI003566C95F
MDISTEGPTLVLTGDFDVRSTWEVRKALYAHLQGNRQDVFVDLSRVTAVDVTALKVLAMATREASRSGRHLRLRGCGPAVRRMLHISRLIRVVEIERQTANA